MIAMNGKRKYHGTAVYAAPLYSAASLPAQLMQVHPAGAVWLGSEARIHADRKKYSHTITCVMRLILVTKSLYGLG
jgi:hypothetical protein